ncbi:hypothetical protein ACHAWO_007455 [Cyclotella atomus]|uniref:Uncharacterized protein n=1 Tax=Cyclotella atomus TaxID=382360 RepID=A0ABD3NZ93_9STRA
MTRRKRKPIHTLENQNVRILAGISAAFATSLFVIAFMIAAATCFLTSGFALQAYQESRRSEVDG